MKYTVIRVTGSLVALELAVQDRVREGWRPEGAPFRDPDNAQWCQAMTATESQVNLRETKRK